MKENSKPKNGFGRKKCMSKVKRPFKNLVFFVKGREMSKHTLIDAATQSFFNNSKKYSMQRKNKPQLSLYTLTCPMDGQKMV